MQSCANFYIITSVRRNKTIALAMKFYCEQKTKNPLKTVLQGKQTGH